MMECPVRSNCWAHAERCWFCRFGDDPESGSDNYIPIDKNIKHPQIEAEKQARKDDRKAAFKANRENRDSKRIKIQKNANKAERKVKESLNSGRVNRDGDLHAEDIAIDVKLQSTRLNPVVDLEELDKIRNDAIRGGKQYGVLALVNKNGRTVYVMDEDIFGRLI